MMQEKKAVPYYRVSTDKQGKSRLGLEAQQKTVVDFAAANGLRLLPEHVEVESGKNNQRPILKNALDLCKKEKAVLLIAKLDRLARNVAFIAKLMEADVDFTAVDNPDANKLVLHIMAAVAEYERDQTSKRTKDALAAAKRRGIKLGENGRNVLSKKNQLAANEFAVKMQPIISKLKEEGYITMRELTEALNKKKIPTYRGNHAKWHLHSVYSLIKRIAKLSPIQYQEPINPT